MSRVPTAVQKMRQAEEADLAAIARGEIPPSLVRTQPQPPAQPPDDDGDEPGQHAAAPDDDPGNDPNDLPPRLPAAGDDDDGETWRQKYERIKAKLDSMADIQGERDRANNRVLELEAEVGRLRAMTADRGGGGGNAQPIVAPPIAPEATRAAIRQRLQGMNIHQKLAPGMGDELANQVAEVMIDLAASAVDPVIESTAAQSANAFVRAIQSRLPPGSPSIESLGTDPNFQRWAFTEIRPGSGVTRQHLFQGYSNSGDVAGCVDLYTEYLTATGAVRAPTGDEGQPPAAQPGGKQNAQRAPLASRVAPGSAPTAPAPPKPSAKTYTRSQVEATADEISRKRNELLRTNPARLTELTQIYADMERAQAEGRVIG